MCSGSGHLLSFLSVTGTLIFCSSGTDLVFSLKCTGSKRRTSDLLGCQVRVDRAVSFCLKDELIFITKSKCFLVALAFFYMWVEKLST